MKKPADWNLWAWLGTDRRKKFRLSFNYSITQNFDDAGTFNFYSGNISFRPNNTILFSAGPFYSDITPAMQYVTAVDYNNEKRYIISRMHQSTFGLSMRLEYYITPDLSVQYYGQPFISAGNYSEFKRVTDPKAKEYEDRFHLYSDNEITYNSGNNTYDIDENHDGSVDYYFDDPNFNFMQFRSNFVVRWEYIPGSTAYFVWSQGRTGSNPEGDFAFKNDMQNLFDIHPHNIFLIKVSYRLRL